MKQKRPLPKLKNWIIFDEQKFKARLKDPKSKTRLAIDLMLLAIVVGIVGLVVYENNRHHQLKTSAEKLKASLEATGIPASGVGTSCEKSGGGKTVTSWHQCTMHFKYAQESIVVAEANVLLVKAEEAAASVSDFTKTDHFVLIDELGRGYRGPSIGLTHKSTGRECSLFYQSSLSYDAKDTVELRLEFICDDDSWFNKTFRRFL